MTREEIMNLNASEIEERKSILAEEASTADSERLDAINEELDAIEVRCAQIKTEARAAAAVAAGAGVQIGGPVPMNPTYTVDEVRSMPRYVEAYANDLKAGNGMKESRAVLTELTNIEGDGPVPVPSFVEDRIKTAWEKNEAWQLFTKTYVRGVLRVGFEASASPAAIHIEGDEAPAPEELVLGTVQLVAKTFKKWISVSTEVLAMGPYDFLAYLYDEITYRIIKAAVDYAFDLIADGNETIPSEHFSSELGLDTIVQAEGYITGDPEKIYAVMHRGTYAALKAAALNANYGVDPFDGAQVVFNNNLSAYDVAGDGDVFMIVGDLAAIQANLPEGDTVRFIFDEYSLAEQDLIKVVGRMMAGIDVTRPGMLVAVEKGADSE